LPPFPAVDIFNGGVKSNAVAEQATAVVNHRVATHSSISELKQEYIRELGWLAQQLDLELFAWGEKVEEFHPRSHMHFPTDGSGKMRYTENHPFIGKLFIEAWSEPLEPAPKTPISNEDENAKAWRLFSSVIRNVWKVDEHGEMDESEAGEGIIVAPSLMQGNTDTQRYWGFTKNIFRFGPSSLKTDLTGLGSLKG